MALNPKYSDNPDPRVPCLLLLDTSLSMQGAPLQALNQGLRDFQVELQEDALVQRRAEIAIVTFGGTVQTVQDFVTGNAFSAPTLTASGNTPMGEAIAHGVMMVKQKVAELRENGVELYKPWIFLMTDGEPSGEWHSAAELVKRELASNSMIFFGVGIGPNANLKVLSEITPRALKLDGLKFHECFLWVGDSLRSISRSQSTDQVPLGPVTFGSPV